jgi:hypothetical protein
MAGGAGIRRGKRLRGAEAGIADWDAGDSGQRPAADAALVREQKGEKGMVGRPRKSGNEDRGPTTREDPPPTRYLVYNIRSGIDSGQSAKIQHLPEIEREASPPFRPPRWPAGCPPPTPANSALPFRSASQTTGPFVASNQPLQVAEHGVARRNATPACSGVKFHGWKQGARRPSKSGRAGSAPLSAAGGHSGFNGRGKAQWVRERRRALRQKSAR